MSNPNKRSFKPAKTFANMLRKLFRRPVLDKYGATEELFEIDLARRARNAPQENTLVVEAHILVNQRNVRYISLEIRLEELYKT